MDMILKMMRSGCNPLDEMGQDLSPEHEDALNRYESAYNAIRQSGLNPELFKKYEDAVMELHSLSEERLFCFAIRYGAALQRDLMC